MKFEKKSVRLTKTCYKIPLGFFGAAKLGEMNKEDKTIKEKLTESVLEQVPVDVKFLLK